MSPLAEGRELKCFYLPNSASLALSPLAEGRELKYHLEASLHCELLVAPRGGA